MVDKLHSGNTCQSHFSKKSWMSDSSQRRSFRFQCKLSAWQVSPLLCFNSACFCFSHSLTSEFSLFVNYSDRFYCMPSYKKNIPRGTTESWPRSCSIIIGNWLLHPERKLVDTWLSVHRPPQSKDTILHSFPWSSFYCWVKWQACFLYINNNHMKEHTRHGYMEVKAVCVCVWSQWVQDIDNDSCMVFIC